MTGTDEFTFPVITDSHSCSIDSPPLWRLSPAKDGNEKDEEEKMDVLWEDFNEELSGCSSSSSSSSSRLKPAKKSGTGGDMAEMDCVQALNLSKNPGKANTIFSSRKPGFVVFVKVLKKLFLLHHHSHRRNSVKKNRPW